MIAFECQRGNDKWRSQIMELIDHGSHYEMIVEGRTRIHIIFGEALAGNFLCILNYRVSFSIAKLADTFWNTERISAEIGDVDAITVAQALYIIADSI
jgi:hypothetical protein